MVNIANTQISMLSGIQTSIPSYLKKYMLRQNGTRGFQNSIKRKKIIPFS